MLTAEIIRTAAYRPFHLRPAEELEHVAISSASTWNDDVWQLDNPSIGQRGGASRLAWKMVLPDGCNLIDPVYNDLLDWLRRFAWSLFVDPREKAKAYKVGNASQITQGLRVVVPWMVEHAFAWPNELDRSAVASFLDDLPGIIAEEIDDEEVITEGAAYMPIKIIDLLWRQRKALSDAGVPTMLEKPWSDAKGANSIAKRIATEARGWIKPLPDEVAIPILNKAAWFLGAPSEDVLSLVEAMEKVYYRSPGQHGNGPGTTSTNRCRLQVEVVKAWTFSTLDGECEPWNLSLANRQGRNGAVYVVRRLLAGVQGAACIIIQASTGMRASEMCALRHGVDQMTGLPAGVRIVRSSSGLNEVFVLRSELTKQEETPRDVDWLLGMRPLGSDEIPLPVRAMLLLNRVLARQRKMARLNQLIVGFNRGKGFPRDRGASRFTTLSLNDLVKGFVQEWVDLSGLPDESAHRVSKDDLVPWRESKGRIIRSHQFRKTYAQFSLSIDPRLLPAVQRQFHHVQLAMTEGGYWGRNRIQVEPVNAMASQLTAMQLFELATGRTRVAGKMGMKLEERIGEIRQLVEGLGIESGWRRVVRFVRDNSLHMWFAPPGSCLPLNPSNMECHKVAGTRPIGLPIPNYSTREPSLCAGCGCFVLDLRHVGFWQERYVTNQVAYMQAKARGQGDMFRVASARAEVARKLLQRLGIEMAPLEERVQMGSSDARH